MLKCKMVLLVIVLTLTGRASDANDHQHATESLCRTGVRVTALYAGRTISETGAPEPCSAALEACWFEGVVTEPFAASSHLHDINGKDRLVEISWLDGDSSFRHVPAQHVWVDDPEGGSFCEEPNRDFFIGQSLAEGSSTDSVGTLLEIALTNVKAFLSAALGLQGLDKIAKLLAMRTWLLAALEAVEQLPEPLKTTRSADLEAAIRHLKGPGDPISPMELLWGCKHVLGQLGWIQNQAHFREQHLFAPILARLHLLRATEPSCLAENTKSPFEKRCQMVQLENALMPLKFLKQWGFVKLVLEAADARGSGVMSWTSMHQTPQVKVPGLDSRGIWQRKDDFFVDTIAGALEMNFQDILTDLHQILTKPWAHDAEFIAYPGLVESGSWYKWSLFNGRSWNETLRAVAKNICSSLRGLLPSKGIIRFNSTYQAEFVLPYVGTGNDEEVVLFETKPGSHVCPHNGGTNTRLNIHLGLQDVEGSTISVYGVNGMSHGTRLDFEWEVGKVGPIFDDSFDHEVKTPDWVPRNRYVLAVGILHPDLRNEPGRYAGAFNRKTAIDSWDETTHSNFEALSALMTESSLNSDRVEGLLRSTQVH